MERCIVKMMAQGLAVVVLFISTNIGAVVDHTCSDCHASAAPSASDLIQPLSGLCANCHIDRITAGEHVVGIPVSAPDNTLPLHDGMMSCATCHDPHQPFAALRMANPELCRQCHLK